MDFCLTKKRCQSLAFNIGVALTLLGPEKISSVSTLSQFFSSRFNTFKMFFFQKKKQIHKMEVSRFLKQYFYVKLDHLPNFRGEDFKQKKIDVFFVQTIFVPLLSQFKMFKGRGKPRMLPSLWQNH